MVASTLNIKPVCAALNGEIIQVTQGLGMQKSLSKLANEMLKRAEDLSKRRIFINHCNNEERALKMKAILLDRVPDLNIHILSLRGLSTVYANDGGIVVTF